jgi:8-oxo-dGTP diphosphatase
MKVVTAAIIQAGGSFLIARRAPGEKLAGFWEFPGGKVEPNETHQDCLERELQEELGLTIRAGDVITESVYHYEHGSINLVAISASIVEGEIRLSVHDEVEWLSIDKIIGLNLAPADIPIAQQLKEIGYGF